MDADAYADMLPWLMFVVIDRRSGLDVGWAAGSAVVCSLALLGWAYWRGRRSPVALVGLAVFSASLVGAFVSSTWDTSLGLSRGLTISCLGVAAFASLPWAPLSESYTAPFVVTGLRADPRFRATNREITAGWATGAMLVAIACATTAAVRGVFVVTFFDWVLPLLLAVATMLWAARRWELFRLATDLQGGAAERSSVTLAWRQGDRLEQVSAAGEADDDGGGPGARIHLLAPERRRKIQS